MADQREHYQCVRTTDVYLDEDDEGGDGATIQYFPLPSITPVVLVHIHLDQHIQYAK